MRSMCRILFDLSLLYCTYCITIYDITLDHPLLVLVPSKPWILAVVPKVVLSHTKRDAVKEKKQEDQKEGVEAAALVQPQAEILASSPSVGWAVPRQGHLYHWSLRICWRSVTLSGNLLPWAAASGLFPLSRQPRHHLSPLDPASLGRSFYCEDPGPLPHLLALLTNLYSTSLQPASHGTTVLSVFVLVSRVLVALCATNTELYIQLTRRTGCGNKIVSPAILSAVHATAARLGAKVWY